MTKTLKILLASMLVAVAVLSTGCTRNDGDIGDLFGRWRFDTLTADGVELPLYGEGSGTDVELYAMWFQGSLVWIHSLYPHQAYSNFKGMWTRTDTQLLLDFSYRDIEGNTFYTPPAALHLVAGGITPLNIESETSSRMHLWYVAHDGVRYDYFLTKVY